MCPLFPARQAALAVIQTLALSVPTSPSAFLASIPYIVQLLDKLTEEEASLVEAGAPVSLVRSDSGGLSPSPWLVEV